MNTITIEGIPFTEEVLTTFREWIMHYQLAGGKGISSCVADDVKFIDSIQSYLMSYWNSLPEDDNMPMKHLLTNLQFLKERLTIFSSISIEI